MFVIGSGRSGTSLTARILNILGVDLGSEDGLIAGDGNNARGYWERWDIHTLNTHLLTASGGEFAAPPALVDGWERSDDLAGLRRRAGRLIEHLFHGRALWGVKDPMLSLTLPLWHDLVPERRHVICVRDPAEASASFARFVLRGGLAGRTWPAVWCWPDLWFHYTATALVNTSGQHRTLVFYDRYFVDCEDTIESLAGLIGLQLTSSARRRLAEVVDAELRHHWPGRVEAGSDLDVVPEASLLYSALRAAGPHACEREIAEVELLARELLVERARRAPLDGPAELARPKQASVPSSIRVLPDDLAGARYYGVWSDGWLERESSLSLAAGDGTLLQMRALVPEAEGQHVTVSVDGTVVEALAAGPGILDLTVPIAASSGPRRIDLRWTKVVALSRPDWRAAAALLECIALVQSVT